MRLTLHRLAVASVMATGLAGFAGCKSQNFDPLSMSFRDQAVGAVPQDQLPEEVQTAFREQFPKATITRVEQRRHSGGDQFYRVHFALPDQPGAERVMDYNMNDTPYSGRR